MNYILLSSLILVGAFVPFLIIYEKRKPKAREVVLLAVMSAITVVSNMICAYTVPFHAGTAVVIITGIALGPEAGFFTGALSRFVCNFFMGQGSWTPWEMFAWGVLGALAGTFFSKYKLTGHLDDKDKVRKDSLKASSNALLIPVACLVLSEIAAYIIYLFTAKDGEPFWGIRVYLSGFIGIVMALVLTRKKLPVNYITITVFTFVSVFVVYGGIMNFAAYIMTGMGDVQALFALYISGVAYDLWHAGGAAVIALFFGEVFIGRLERIKIKYGMYKK